MKANDGINFLINKIFGGKKKDEKIEDKKESSNENVSIDYNGEVKIKK